MLENRRAYTWYVVINLLFGVGIFLVSLFYALTGIAANGEGRHLYFGREILPDHVFYPVMAAVDRFELLAATPEEQFRLRQQLAIKRLLAAEQLYLQGQNELAFATLGKAHQYLLQANQDWEHLSHPEKMYLDLVRLNNKFINKYSHLHRYMSDSQWASVTQMAQAIKYVQEDGP